MSITAAKLQAEVGADTTGFDRGMTHADQRVAGAGSKWGKALKTGIGIGLATVGVVAVRGIIGAMNAGLDSLREQQVVVAQTNAVILSTGNAAHVSAAGVRDLSTELERKSGFDDKAIQTGANLLLTFTNIRNEVGAGNDIFNQSTEIMTNMARALGTDASGAAIQLGKALNDPVKGVTALTRVGVTFDKQQIKRIKQFVKEGKVVEAQKIILAELNKEFGKSNQEFMKTDAGKALLFQDAIEGIQQKLATGLLPAITSIQGALTKFLTDPATMGQVEALGNSIAGIFSEGNLRTAASIMTTAAGAIGTAIKLFSSLPKEVQALAVGAFALNKITGISPLDIVKTAMSAFRGVMGIQAGVVNVTGAVVNGGGVPGVPPVVRRAGGGGLLATAASGIGIGLALPVAIGLLPKVMAEAFKLAGTLTPEIITQERGVTAQARGLDPTKVRSGYATPAGGLPSGWLGGDLKGWGARHQGNGKAPQMGGRSPDDRNQVRTAGEAAVLERAVKAGLTPTADQITRTWNATSGRQEAALDRSRAAMLVAANAIRDRPAPSTTVNLTINVPKVQSYIQTIQRTIRYGPMGPNKQRQIAEFG